jgi:hypothetical protein
MKNKNLLWILAGVGAGFVAFYMKCKMNQGVYTVQGVPVGEEDEMESRMATVGGGGGGGGAFMPSTPVATPVIATPSTIAVIPSDVLYPTNPLIVSTTPTTTPTTTITAKEPVIVPVTSPTAPAPTQPISTTKPTTTISTQPIIKPISPVIAPVSTKSGFSGFNGGGDLFECGEKLNDLY